MPVSGRATSAALPLIAVLALATAGCTQTTAPSTSQATAGSAAAPSESAPAAAKTQAASTEWTTASLIEVLQGVDGLTVSSESDVDATRSMTAETLAQMKDMNITPAACKEAVVASLSATDPETMQFALATSGSGSITVRGVADPAEAQAQVEQVTAQAAACATAEMGGMSTTNKLIDVTVPAADAAAAVETSASGVTVVSITASVDNVVILASQVPEAGLDAAAAQVDAVASAFRS